MKYHFSLIAIDPCRLDKLLVQIFPEYTRSYIQTLCEKEKILLNGKQAKKRDIVEIQDEIHMFLPREQLAIKPEKMDLDIVFENDNFAIINKDPFINVHPVSGEWGTTGTLVNGLLHHFKDLSVINGVERPGIVHRLDKETSGLLVIAKNDTSMQELQRMFQDKQIKKTYVALVCGAMREESGEITSDIGRDRHHRKRMTTKNPINPKYAETHYTVRDVLEFGGQSYSLLDVGLLTGRTHQIRVHMADTWHPIVGDRVYGLGRVNKFFEKEYWLKRQFLHAHKLEFELFGESFSFEGEVKEDLCII